MPQWYLDEPMLSRTDEFYISAFWEISIGEPIPWWERVAYAERKGLEPDMVDAFSHIIRELDNEYQLYRSAQLKKETNSNGSL